MRISKNDVLFYVALLCAIWFAWMGMVWTYWAALVVAYPFGLISFLIWRTLRRDNRKRNRVIPVLLSIGLVLSMLVLIYLLIWD